MTALPKERRLPAKPFEKVFKKGKNWQTSFLGLKALKLKNSLSATRFGWVVGLKVSKKAVQRNKLRRQLKAVVYELLPEIKPGFDIIVLAKPSALNQNYAELKKEMIELLKRAGVLPKSKEQTTSK